MSEKPSPEFVRPAFLDKHDLRTDAKIGEGSFVMVRGIPAIDLPPEASKKFPEGFVIKQYKPISPEKDAELFGADNLSLEEKRKALIASYRAIRDYFSAELPELVLKTSVLIGKDRSNHELGLYELQEKVADFVSVFPSDLYLVVKDWEGIRQFNKDILYTWGGPPWWLDRWKKDRVERLRALSLTEAGMQNLVEQLRAFIRLAKTMPEQSSPASVRDKYVDIRGPDNLLITRSGELKLIDTNRLYDRKEMASAVLWDEFKARLATLEQLAAAIEAAPPLPPNPPRS